MRNVFPDAPEPTQQIMHRQWFMEMCNRYKTLCELRERMEQLEADFAKAARARDEQREALDRLPGDDWRTPSCFSSPIIDRRRRLWKQWQLRAWRLEKELTPVKEQFEVAEKRITAWDPPPAWPLYNSDQEHSDAELLDVEPSGPSEDED